MAYAHTRTHSINSSNNISEEFHFSFLFELILYSMSSVVFVSHACTHTHSYAHIRQRLKQRDINANMLYTRYVWGALWQHTSIWPFSELSHIISTVDGYIAHFIIIWSIRMTDQRTLISIHTSALSVFASDSVHAYGLYGMDILWVCSYSCSCSCIQSVVIFF